MKEMTRRIFAAMVALILCIGTIGGMVPAAHAEEIPQTDAYVLSYDGAVEGYTYGHLPYMYKSPFKMYHSYNDPAAGPNSVWAYTYTNEIFQLINTTKVGQGGEGAYASIPVYCTDADTGTRSSTTYRRINLEDSTYHVSGAAARLRAVILNSFPYVQDMAAITAAANAYLEANGQTQIQNLQIGEAMLATQQAIWTITHGGKYKVENHYTGMGSYDGSDAVYQINSAETETEFTSGNILGMFQYLCSLKGVGPMADAVSEATFENVTYSAVPANGGKYTITVTCDVVTNVRQGDSLTLSASCGDQAQSLELSQGGTYSFTFEGLEERLEVMLQLNGYQTGGDVYLFDSEGNRDHSQSMIGYDSSTLPVHGEVVATPDRIINIYKTTGKDQGSMPLSNIEFDIYQVATLSEVETGKVTLHETPTAEEIAKYQKEENWIVTLKTDIQGYATYNFTDNGHPDGLYLVAERHSAATTGPVEPFFVVIPATNADGSAHVYTVTVNPKNTTETGPDVKKDVTEIENNSDSYNVGTIHPWIIRGGVPAGIATAVEYTITDTIDYRLTYQKGSPVVKLYTRADEEKLLQPDSHYTLSEGTLQVDGKTVDRFAVSLTAEGMAYVAANLDQGEAIPEVRVYFDAVINSNASMGQNIPNKAHLDYRNSAGVEYDAESDEPEVHTGGTNILKTDAEGNVLPGAVFKIAREATQAEIDDESVAKETLIVDKKELAVVFVDFYPTADLSGEKVIEVTTDQEGKAVLYGLAYGNYYILEMKAPAGYNLLTAPIAVTINKYSHLTAAHEICDDEGALIDNTIRVINTKYVLPQTGGAGTTVFTVTGIAIIGSAALLLMFNNKKKGV